MVMSSNSLICPTNSPISHVWQRKVLSPKKLKPENVWHFCLENDWNDLLIIWLTLTGGSKPLPVNHHHPPSLLLSIFPKWKTSTLLSCMCSAERTPNLEVVKNTKEITEHGRNTWGRYKVNYHISSLNHSWTGKYMCIKQCKSVQRWISPLRSVILNLCTDVNLNRCAMQRWPTSKSALASRSHQIYSL